MAGKKGMKGGGRRPGAGRKRGGRNRSTLALREEITKHGRSRASTCALPPS